jgi:low affinity Fe/Cu permease
MFRQEIPRLAFNRDARNWAMTLFIQRAEHRDTQAIHAKLDELLKVHGDAQNNLMNLDDEDAEEVEHARDKVKET